MPPSNQYQGQCPVCGMVRPMWARTWITFNPVKNVSQVCSFHCLADWIIKSGQEPTNVMLSIYHQPERAILASDAFIVLGSTAAGTMSPVSKIVFADKSKAEGFAQNCGGEIIDYTRALQIAKASVAKENKMINARRLKKGKIVEPNESDSCLVCGMYPIRYPYGKCQIISKDGQTIHFCSTQCLFAFLGKQKLYMDTAINPFLIWVVDRNSGMWISGRTAFYVIGSKKVFGPMGYEALPFNSLKEAEDFAAENGGAAVTFGDVTIYKVVPKWKYSIDGAGQ
jgi:nitrous oxide reductase accessory protein NosL